MDLQMIENSLKEFMDGHPDLTAYDYIHKEDQDLLLFMNGLIENSVLLQGILEFGTEKDMIDFLEVISEKSELSALVICLEKNMVANLKKREDLQQTISKEIVRWFRRGGWKFPKLNIEQ